MLFFVGFQVKSVSLDIIFSENFIEEIRLNNLRNMDVQTAQARNGNAVLSETAHTENPGNALALINTADYQKFRHLSALLSLIDYYFSGKPADFYKIPVNTEKYPDFTRNILEATRKVKYGETISYGELALRAGFGKKYSRACASALSSNKTPLIIPCHRIIRSDGSPGGYSGGGGTKFKRRLLSLENRH